MNLPPSIVVGPGSSNEILGSDAGRMHGASGYQGTFIHPMIFACSPVQVFEPWVFDCISRTLCRHFLCTEAEFDRFSRGHGKQVHDAVDDAPPLSRSLVDIHPAFCVLIIYQINIPNLFVHSADNDFLPPFAPHRAGSKCFKTVILVAPAAYHLKFIVDDVWRCSDDLPTATDGAGHLVNYIDVRRRGEEIKEWGKDWWGVGTEDEEDQGTFFFLDLLASVLILVHGL